MGETCTPKSGYVLNFSNRTFQNFVLDNAGIDLYEDENCTGSGSTEVQNEIFDALEKKTFSNNGLVLDSVGIREIKFSENYVGAIESKQIEAVKVETEENRAAQAKFRKEAAITEAEAQARSQELQRTTISPELLEKLWVERWDGHLPPYMMGDRASNLIQLPN